MPKNKKSRLSASHRYVTILLSRPQKGRYVYISGIGQRAEKKLCVLPAWDVIAGTFVIDCKHNTQYKWST